MFSVILDPIFGNFGTKLDKLTKSYINYIKFVCLFIFQNEIEIKLKWYKMQFHAPTVTNLVQKQTNKHTEQSRAERGKNYIFLTHNASHYFYTDLMVSRRKK